MTQLVTHNVGELVTRIQLQTSRLAPSSPHLKEALMRIGLYVTSMAKVNVRQRGLIDTGRLINSMRYEFFKDGPIEGIQIGSFNVPYAAVHEFGYRGVMRLPTYQRRMSQAFGRPIEPRIVTIGSHTRNVNIRARPYLRPAVTVARTFIIDTLRQALLFAQSGGNGR